jgi:hypothetical protein
MNCKVQSRMKIMLLIWFLLGISVRVARGQRTPSHAAQAISSHAQPHRQTVSITFLAVPNGSPVHNFASDQATLDLGSFSYFPRFDVKGAEIQRQEDSFIVLTRFGLCIDLSNGHHIGTATVSAFLLSPNFIGNVWVDGLRLSITPGIIGRQVRYGAFIEHILKIAVPISMPAGQLLESIGVIVTPN